MIRLNSFFTKSRVLKICAWFGVPSYILKMGGEFAAKAIISLPMAQMNANCFSNERPPLLVNY
jgi:hypothetical protein